LASQLNSRQTLEPSATSRPGLRILFVIRSLHTGGAERQLVQLAHGLAHRGVHVGVAVMYGGGALERELTTAPGIELLDLGKKSRWDMAAFGTRAVRLARMFRPDLLHGYMSGANELALLIGKLLRRPVIWGIRVSDQNFGDYSGFRRLVFDFGRLMSKLPELIIANSEVGRQFHVARGYPLERFTVISNGIDISRFRRDERRGLAWRKANQIDQGCALVTLPARLDPMKDHVTFVQAIAFAVRERPDLCFVAAGRGSARETAAFDALLETHGVQRYVRRLPSEEKVEDLYNASDIVTLSSAFGEGFPNVIGEAMACERMCAATDTGDTAIVIGDAGRVVPVRAPDHLAAAWLDLLVLSKLERANLESRARHRIETNFSIEKMVTSSIAQFELVVSGAR
jgi:glycosyltransferase involved in cell wall biosynthesis